jgi:hypothetical protein
MSKFVCNLIQQEGLWSKPRSPLPARAQKPSIKYERRCHWDLQPVYQSRRSSANFCG